MERISYSLAIAWSKEVKEDYQSLWSILYLWQIPQVPAEEPPTDFSDRILPGPENRSRTDDPQGPPQQFPAGKNPNPDHLTN